MQELLRFFAIRWKFWMFLYFLACLICTDFFIEDQFSYRERIHSSVFRFGAHTDHTTWERLESDISNEKTTSVIEKLTNTDTIDSGC